MPKRFSKNKAVPSTGKDLSAKSGDDGHGQPRSAAGTTAPDTESEFSVPQKWRENEQENANASSGPSSAARDGESSEEAADTRAS